MKSVKLFSETVVSRSIAKTFLLVAVLFAVAIGSAPAAVPGILNYQGRISATGAVYDGTGYFKFALVDAAGTTTYWSHDGSSASGSEPATSLAVTVSSGLFTINLGDTSVVNMTQAIPSTAVQTSNVYVKIWFGTNSTTFQALSPAARLTAVGYALNAARSESVADGVVSSATLADNSVTGSKLDTNITITTTGAMTAASFSGNGFGLTNLNSTNLTGTITVSAGKVGIGTNSPQTLLHLRNDDTPTIRMDQSGLTYSAQTWDIGANHTNFFVRDGTSTGTPTPFRIETGAPSNAFYLKSSGALGIGTASPGAQLEVAAGQFALNLKGTNSVGTWFRTANSSTGGRDWAIISTGAGNSEGAGKLLIRDHTLGTVRLTVSTNGNVGIGTNSPSTALEVVGTVTATAVVTGYGNKLTGTYSTVGGGLNNTNIGSYSAIGGGELNSIASAADHSVISGGNANSIGLSSYNGTVAGGYNNIIGTNAMNSTISGGNDNQISSSADGGTIAGGAFNIIASSATHAYLGGGDHNTIGTNANNSVISGGYLNSISYNTSKGFIGGGNNNSIGASSSESAIAGGFQNQVGATTQSGFIGGGRNNSIGASSSESTIAGGFQNQIGANTDSGFIGGGYLNVIGTNAYTSMIGGGYENTIGANCEGAVVVGGSINAISNSSPHSVIVGGDQNAIGTNTYNSSILGGLNNSVGSSAPKNIIVGGSYNTVSSTADHTVIGGGQGNIVSAGAYCSTIPGGYSNTVASSGSFAAGRYASATNLGSFVWGDGNGAFTSSASYQFLIRAKAGVGINTNSPKGTLHVAGTTSLTAYFDSTSTSGTWLSLTNSSTNGRKWDIISTGSGSGEGAGKLLFYDGTAATTRMQIDTNGRVAIGYSGSTSLTNTLDVNGTIKCQTLYQTSDRNLKKDIAPLGEMLAKIMELKPSSYHFKNESDTGAMHIGFIAQDVEQVFPESVQKSADHLALNYNDVSVAGIKALQELKQEKDSEIHNLKSENNDLKQRLANVERALTILINRTEKTTEREKE